MNRREFLVWVGQAGVVFCLGAVAAQVDSNRQFLRPPGALAHQGLLSHCIKCQKCREVCPTNIVQPVSVTEHLVGTGTPRLDFDLGYCTLCMRCVEACPSGALQPIAKEAAKLGTARVLTQECVAWTWGGCGKCAQECPLGAIRLDENGRPVVDESVCNGCGLCEYICPNASLRVAEGRPGKGIVVLPVGTLAQPMSGSDESLYTTANVIT